MILITDYHFLLGIDEAPLKLLVCTLLTYPLSAVFDRLFIYHRRTRCAPTSSTMLAKHLFIIVSGLFLMYTAYGDECLHLLATTVGSWALLRAMGPSQHAVHAVFAFTMTYLLVGYWRNNTGDYVVDYTMSQCVLVLRLIGLAFDYADGQAKKPSSTPSKSAADDGKPHVWDDCALVELPSLLETLSFSLFWGGALIGPQFPFAHHRKYLTLEVFERYPGGSVERPSKGDRVWRCFALGTAYLAASQLANIYLPSSYVATLAFAQSSWLYKLVYVPLAGKGVLTKYVGLWLLNEGASVISGISFTGYTGKSGKMAVWDELANINPLQFETATSLHHIVESFNMNTNLWSKKYIFKRLRFLGNKNLSAFGTLTFLAIWHGFSFGYFAAFYLEFIDMMAVTVLSGWLAKLVPAVVRDSLPMKAAQYYTVACALGVGVLTFDLLTMSRVLAFWSAIRYANHWALAGVIGAGAVVDALLKRKSTTSKKTQ